MYSVIKGIDRADKELVKKFASIGESASIYEIMKSGAMSCDMRPVWPGTRMCGTALTVHTRPADNLMLHKAIDMVQPGDVVVVCCEGFTEAGGMFGGLMAASLKQKGCAGLVTDGSVRDTMMFKELGLPVYSRGINVKCSTKMHGGTINHPIIVCGVLVRPGDIIFGDNDSVVVVPKEIAEEVYKDTIAREEREEVMLKRIMSGEGTTFDFAYRSVYEKLGLDEEK